MDRLSTVDSNHLNLSGERRQLSIEEKKGSYGMKETSLK